MRTKEELESEFEQQYSHALEITNYLNEFDDFIKRTSSLKNKIDQETDDLVAEYSSKWFVVYSTFQVYLIAKICHVLGLRFSFDGSGVVRNNDAGVFIRIRAPESLFTIISKEVSRIENIIKILFGTSDQDEGYPACSSFEDTML